MTKTLSEVAKDGGPEEISGPLPVLGPLRTCTKCGEVKTLDEYYKKPSGSLGHRTRCRTCTRADNDAWHDKNRGRVKEYRRNWYKENRDSILAVNRDWYQNNKERRAEAGRRWWKNNPDKAFNIWKRSYHKRRALVAGVEISQVDLDDLWTGYCALCGGVLDYDLKYPDPLSKSLDHATPLSLGGAHSKENLQWTHWFCNISKGADV